MNNNLSIGRSLKRYLLLAGLITLFCLCSNVAYAPVKVQSRLHQSKVVYITRVTAANFRSRINCEGKSLWKLAKAYGNICAVEQKTLLLYTPVYIAGVRYMIVDVMHKPSVKKHYRRASKRGISLDLCLDLYLPVPTRQLHKYDLGITEITVIK